MKQHILLSCLLVITSHNVLFSMEMTKEENSKLLVRTDSKPSVETLKNTLKASDILRVIKTCVKQILDYQPTAVWVEIFSDIINEDPNTPQQFAKNNSKINFKNKLLSIVEQLTPRITILNIQDPLKDLRWLQELLSIFQPWCKLVSEGKSFLTDVEKNKIGDLCDQLLIKTGEIIDKYVNTTLEQESTTWETCFFEVVGEAKENKLYTAGRNLTLSSLADAIMPRLKGLSKEQLNTLLSMKCWANEQENKRVKALWDEIKILMRQINASKMEVFKPDLQALAKRQKAMTKEKWSKKELEKELEKMKNELEKVTDELENSKEQLEMVTGELDTKKIELEKSLKSQYALEAKLEEIITAENSSTVFLTSNTGTSQKASPSEKPAGKQSKLDEVSKLQKELANLAQKLKKADEKNDQLKIENQKLRNAENTPPSDLEKLKKTHRDEIEKLTDTKNTELQNLQNQIGELQKKLTESKKTSALTPELEALKRTHKDEIDELTSAKNTELTKLQKQIKDLQKGLADAQNNSSELEALKKTHKDEIDELTSAKKTEFTNLKTEIAELKKKLTDAQNTSSELEALKKTHKDEIDELTNAKETEFTNLKTEITELKKKLTDAQNELETLKKTHNDEIDKLNSAKKTRIQNLQKQSAKIFQDKVTKLKSLVTLFWLKGDYNKARLLLENLQKEQSLDAKMQTFIWRYLAEMYHHGRGGLQMNKEKAIELFTKVANQNDDKEARAFALHYLGEMYYGEKNLAKAIECFQLAAKQNDNPSIQTDAFLSLGKIQSEQKNYDHAINWYKKAEQSVNPKVIRLAKEKLAEIYAITKNHEQASKYYGLLQQEIVN